MWLKREINFKEHAKYSVDSDYYGLFYNKVCVCVCDPGTKKSAVTVESLHEHTKMLFVISKTLLLFHWAFLPSIENKA